GDETRRAKALYRIYSKEEDVDLMFQIVKARADKDTAKDAFLTQKLRDL
ncbi:hypothetical protein OIU74_013214, partial [Salix koriyanagi]